MTIEVYGELSEFNLGTPGSLEWTYLRLREAFELAGEKLPEAAFRPSTLVNHTVVYNGRGATSAVASAGNSYTKKVAADKSNNSAAVAL